jgi:hypothetical protein
MKKISVLLTIGLLFSLVSCKKKEKDNDAAEARFEVMDANGTVLQSGEEFTFNGVGNPDGNMVLLVKNKTSETIELKTKLVDVSGTDGSEFQVCIGNCYPGMALNIEYPLNTSFTIAPGATTGPNDIHYENHFSGSCYYVVELYEVDASGNKVGEAFRFKYIHP